MKPVRQLMQGVNGKAGFITGEGGSGPKTGYIEVAAGVPARDWSTVPIRDILEGIGKKVNMSEESGWVQPGYGAAPTVMRLIKQAKVPGQDISIMHSASGVSAVRGTIMPETITGNPVPDRLECIRHFRTFRTVDICFRIPGALRHAFCDGVPVRGKAGCSGVP